MGKQDLPLKIGPCSTTLYPVQVSVEASVICCDIRVRPFGKFVSA